MMVSTLEWLMKRDVYNSFDGVHIMNSDLKAIDPKLIDKLIKDCKIPENFLGDSEIIQKNRILFERL